MDELVVFGCVYLCVKIVDMDMGWRRVDIWVRGIYIFDMLSTVSPIGPLSLYTA